MEINYAVEIQTGTSTTSTGIGLVSGVFRFVTGRPGYAGAPTYPTYEGGASNTSAWYEGFIVKDGIGKTSRRIKIEESGTYGTNTEFNFNIRNDAKFWNTLLANQIYLTNRAVIFYVVIDDVFYKAFSGIIANNPYNETNYQFIVRDNFNLLHKDFPPVEISNTNFPDAQDEDLALAMPVCIGKVPYARLMNTGGNPTFETLVIANDVSYNCAAATAYTKTNYAKPTLSLKETGISFSENQLQGKYLLTASGTNANTDQAIEILSNTATSVGVTVLTLGNPLDETAGAFVPWASIGGGQIDQNAWYFQISALAVTKKVSQAAITEFKGDSISGFPQLFRYSESEKKIESLQRFIKTASTTDATMTLISDRLERSGDTKWTYPIAPRAVTLMPATVSTRTIVSGSAGNLFDRDRSTFLKLNCVSIYRFDVLRLKVLFPPDARNIDFDDLYLAIDFEVATAGAVNYNFTYTLTGIDCYGYEINSVVSTFSKYPAETEYPLTNNQKLWFLPDDYYANGGVPYSSGESIFGNYARLNATDNQSIKDVMLKVPSSFTTRLKKGENMDGIYMYIQVQVSSAPLTYDINLRQVGFVAFKKVNLVDGALFTRVKGEKRAGVAVETVVDTFKFILEDYDGISPSLIEYGNLETARSAWPVSRQVTQKKNSINYLRELCAQTFTGIYPTRTGKRGIKCWLDVADAVAFFSQENILRDSIKYAAESSIESLYNEYFIRYAWNEATQKFDRTIFITHVNEAAFPSSGSNWKDYVGGIDPLYYAQAKYLWELCHASYLRINQVVKFSVDLPWFSDLAIYENNTSEGARGNPVWIGFGSSTTKFTIENIPFTKQFLKYASFGTPPFFAANGLRRGDTIIIDGSNFDGRNRGTFTVGEVTEYQIEIFNASGVPQYTAFSLGADGVLKTGSGETSDAVFKYVEKLISWNTQAKHIIEFSVPLSSDNVRRDLLDKTVFADAIFTNGAPRIAYISKVEIDPDADAVDIELTMEAAAGELINPVVQDSYISYATYGWADWQDVVSNTNETQDVFT